MLELSKEQIRRLAIDDSTYNRGVRYYKAKAVTNVTWSKGLRQYQAVVHGGNDYRVTVRLKEEENDFQYNCNCPAKIKYHGACKHVIAMLLFLSDYTRMTKEKPQEKEDMAAFRIVHYFEKHEELPVYGETFDALVTVRVEEASEKKLLPGDVFAQASIQIGAGKLYKIQNIKKFLENLHKGQEIQIGKKFRYIPGESSFTPGTEQLFDFFLELYEIQEGDGRSYFSKIFAKSQILLTESMFAKLMKILEGQTFNLELVSENGMEERYEKVAYCQGNPDISFELMESEEELYLTYKEKADITALAGNKRFFFYGETIYEPSAVFLKTFLPFYTELKKREVICFRGTYKEHFISSVLIHLYEQMKIELPESLQERYIREELKSFCYLDRKGADISLKLEFRYGTHSINPLKAYEGGFIVIRDLEKEQEILNLLDSLSFFPYQDLFLLREENAMYYFLTEGSRKLMECCDVFYTDDVRKMRYSAMPSYQTVLRMNEKNNLLELELQSDEFDPEDLKQLFYSMKIKKKYHRLKNGSFLNLEDEELAGIRNLLDSLDVSWQKIENNTISVDKSKAFYLDQALDGNNVRKSQEFKRYIQSFLLPEEEQKLPLVPESITANLRGYQRRGFAWMKNLAEHSLGGILADDMGLGKTLQAITYIGDRIGIGKTAETPVFLIVCPTSLIYNWQEEFAKFAPKLVTHAISGTPAERHAMLASVKEKEIVITSYPLLRRDIEEYRNMVFDTMFIDEAQYIKNPGSLSSHMVKQVRAKHKFALTGTPIENSLGELWSIFNFIMPDYLPKYSRFQTIYEKPIVNKKDPAALRDLEKHIQPFLLRRMKKEVLDELPDKIELKYAAELTTEQRQLYQSYLLALRKQIYGEEEPVAEEGILADIDEEDMELLQKKMPNRLMILSALTRLRQICCHPASFLEDYQGGSGKYNLLMDELIPDLLAGGHRMLIFSQFTSMLELIAKGLEEKKIGFYRLEGSTKTSERRQAVEEFNRGGYSVFLISLKAGGTGLNLTGADTVIHFDPWWNPAVEQQAEDRAYRIGQDKNVQVIRLITQGTIEERIYEMQKKKRELSDTVISAQDIRELFEITDMVL
jgi:SNF2 family DNA or RNA helicase